MNKKYYESKVTIKEHHLDTFGHVNNAVYLTLLEENRWDMISSHGYGLDMVQKSGQGPTVLEVNIRFKRELRNRDEILIRTELLQYDKKIGRLRQTMMNQRSEVCCEAEFVFGLFDTRLRKLIPPTPEWAEAMGIEPPG